MTYLGIVFLTTLALGFIPSILTLKWLFSRFTTRPGVKVHQKPL